MAIVKDPAADSLNEEIESKTINPANLLRNGSFESWSAGTSSAPDSWTLESIGASVSRGGVHTFDSYCSALNVPIGATEHNYLHQEITSFKPYVGKFSLSCWAKCDTANKVRIALTGGFIAYSNYHSGSGNWELLTVTADASDIDSGENIHVQLHCDRGATTVYAYFDGACLVMGEAPFIFAPNPLDIGGEIYGDLTFKNSKTVKGLPAVTDNGDAIGKGQSAGGDLSGSYPNPTVAKIQNRAVDSVAPTDKYPLIWDNTNSKWKPGQLDLSSGAGVVTGELPIANMTDRITWLEPGVLKLNTSGGSVDWADLDFSAQAPGAKYLLLNLGAEKGNGTYEYLEVRKNGSSETWGNVVAASGGSWYYNACICACDANQIIEYKVVTNAGSCSREIWIYGYIK